MEAERHCYSTVEIKTNSVLIQPKRTVTVNCPLTKIVTLAVPIKVKGGVDDSHVSTWQSSSHLNQVVVYESSMVRISAIQPPNIEDCGDNDESTANRRWLPSFPSYNDCDSLALDMIGDFCCWQNFYLLNRTYI